MAIVAFAGGEEGIVGDGVSNSGTSSISTTYAKSGSYSYRTNPTTTGTGAISILAPTPGAGNTWDLSPLAGMADAWTNAWVYIATLPAANNENICRIGNTSTLKLEVNVSSAGKLVVYDRLVALVATGTTTLSTGTWYNIGVRAQNAAGSGAAYEVQINGVSELSGTCSQAANNITRVQWGKVADRNGNSVDYYFDDITVDNAQFNPTIVSKFSQPPANGSTMQWTSGTGASNYTQVNEQPRSTANYVMSTGSAGDVARFTANSMSTDGISGATIKALYTGVYIRENINATTSTSARVVSGATTVDSAAFDPGTTGQSYYGLFLTDPNTGSAWTEANIDAIEYGAIENNAVSTRMVWAGRYILYIPAAGTTTKRLAAMGVG